MNPNPSHDDRFRLEVKGEILALGVRDAPAENADGGVSSISSTSATVESDNLIIPAFFSNNKNKLSWFGYRTLGVVEDVVR